jgi:hypothetical protein
MKKGTEMVNGFPELVYKADVDKQLDLGPTATALDLLEAVYRDPGQELHTRMRAAISCLPFETPKLLATAIVSEGSFAELLEQRIARYNEMKLIEAKAEPTNGKQVEAEPDPEPKPPIELPMSAPLSRVYSNRPVAAKVLTLGE